MKFEGHMKKTRLGQALKLKLSSKQHKRGQNIYGMILILFIKSSYYSPHKQA